MTDSFDDLCRQADERERNRPIDPDIVKLRKLLDDSVSIERVWDELNKRSAAPKATVEALAYQLRGGFAALSEPSARRRLFELNKSQVLEIANRLTRERWGKFENGEKPFRVPPWSETEIKALIKTWSERDGV
jgi:hypothetical protein